MTGARLIRFRSAAVLAAGLMLCALAGCSTVKSYTASPGASSDAEARYMPPTDPLARPVQVGWTSARASHCGFIFNPQQLRATFLAAEARSGNSSAQLAKIEQAYDYTRQSTLETIKDKPDYCSKERTDAIRADLTRYLAGDFTPKARLAR